jgi:hypothetical protein
MAITLGDPVGQPVLALFGPTADYLEAQGGTTGSWGEGKRDITDIDP